jgi:hypothetical protein
MRDIPLVEIEMSVRLDNILRKVGGYETLNQIDEEALKKIKNQRGCGKKSYIELKNILTTYRLEQYNEYDRIVKENEAYLNAIINFKSAFYKLIDLSNINWRAAK